jgi:hypothetical protein
MFPSVTFARKHRSSSAGIRGHLQPETPVIFAGIRIGAMSAADSATDRRHHAHRRPSNPHSRLASPNGSGACRGFLPRGLCDACPRGVHVRACLRVRAGIPQPLTSAVFPISGRKRTSSRPGGVCAHVNRSRQFDRPAGAAAHRATITADTDAKRQFRIAGPSPPS